MTNSGGLMLVWRWLGINAIVQNEFCYTIHLLSQHLLAQSHHWKDKTNVWNLLKVNYKDTRKMSLTLFWCPYTANIRHISYLVLVFLFSIVDFEQVKVWLGSKRHHSEKWWYSTFVVCKKHLIYCNQRWNQNLWHI